MANSYYRKRFCVIYNKVSLVRQAAANKKLTDEQIVDKIKWRYGLTVTQPEVKRYRR